MANNRTVVEEFRPKVGRLTRDFAAHYTYVGIAPRLQKILMSSDRVLFLDVEGWEIGSVVKIVETGEVLRLRGFFPGGSYIVDRSYSAMEPQYAYTGYTAINLTQGDLERVA